MNVTVRVITATVFLKVCWAIEEGYHTPKEFELEAPEALQAARLTSRERN
jgi:hypothetical protein